MSRSHLIRQPTANPSSREPLVFAIVVLLIHIIGCGESVPMGGPRVEVVPVTGKVLVDGKPAESVVVYFRRVSDLNVDLPVPMPRGFTDKNGNISVSSYVSNDGGIPGKYELLFEKASRVNRLTGESSGDVFRGKYFKNYDPEFTVTIPEDVGDEPFDIGTFELTTERK